MEGSQVSFTGNLFLSIKGRKPNPRAKALGFSFCSGNIINMKKGFFDDYKKIHFIGIGGIGISAIARMLLSDGKKVSGSDLSDSEIISELKRVGVKIYQKHDSKNISKDTDLVIYTIAITSDNPELIEAKRRNILCITYSETLNKISSEKYTIAVSGTHGKTTTTAMIAKVTMDNKLDPTVIVGSLLKESKTNFIFGKSEYFIVEACEYRRSFLNIEPKILIITNIDNDHLDYYKDLKDIEKAFNEMAQKVPEKGYIVCDKKALSKTVVLKNAKAKVVDYMDFFSEKIKLNFPGRHNKLDGAVALAVAHILQIDKRKAEKSLSEFSGTWRRFEFKGETKEGTKVYDDYGHHPTEIKATLKGAREIFKKEKIIVVFQPHLFSRTKLLLNDFAKSFVDADEVLLLPIFPAREVFDPTISSEILAKSVIASSVKQSRKSVLSFKSFKDAERYLKQNLKGSEVLITMGAGEAYKIGERIV